MTLIACTLNYKIPILIGDILITNNEKGTFNIPTLKGDFADFLGDEINRSHYLAQKTYVIRPNVCLVMAGNVAEMTDFLRDLKMECAYHGTVTDQHIEAFINRYDVKTNMAESSFLIFVLGEVVLPNITQKHFMHGPWLSYNNELFEGAFTCGVGSKQFFEYMDNIMGVGDENFVIHRHREVVSMNIILTAKILASERATQKTLLNQWGGGFEMVYMYGGEFVKLDNISYLLCTAKVVEGGFDFYPEKLMHYEYFNDVLFIYSLEILNYKKEVLDEIVNITSSEFNFMIYVVRPLDLKEPLADRDLPSFSFGTDLLAVGCSYDVNKFVYTPSYFVGEGNTFVRYGHDEKKLEITVPRKMYDFPKYNMNKKVMEIIDPYIKAYNKKL